MKEKLHFLFDKFTSRKFVVFVVSTVLLCTGKIPADIWMGLALAYVGLEHFADIATRWKTGEVKTSTVEKEE